MSTNESTETSESTTANEVRTTAAYEEYHTSYKAAEAHGFILYGDVQGIAYENMTHRGVFISQLAMKREVILS
jgi:hypothetical protein